MEGSETVAELLQALCYLPILCTSLSAQQPSLIGCSSLFLGVAGVLLRLLLALSFSASWGSLPQHGAHCTVQ